MIHLLSKCSPQAARQRCNYGSDSFVADEFRGPARHPELVRWPSNQQLLIDRQAALKQNCTGRTNPCKLTA